MRNENEFPIPPGVIIDSSQILKEFETVIPGLILSVEVADVSVTTITTQPLDSAEIASLQTLVDNYVPQPPPVAEEFVVRGTISGVSVNGVVPLLKTV